jgi:modulator of FtsH protease HflC
MDNSKTLKIILGVILVSFLIGQTVFTVDQRELAIKLRFGEIVNSDYAPGIHFKWPNPVNSVRIFERRILTINNREARFLTSDKVNLLVDFFVKWRITDVAQFYRAASGSEQRAADRLTEILNDGLRREFALRDVQEIVSADRSEIMGIMTVEANLAAAELGIEIVDVRVRRLDLEEEVSGRVYRNMSSEREAQARLLRAEGNEESERVRANADRERTVLLAEAYRDAEISRGEGDAEAARIYAEAYERDPEFYAFSRSLEAYRVSIGLGQDVLVLDADGEFFDYLRSPDGG